MQISKVINEKGLTLAQVAAELKGRDGKPMSVGSLKHTISKGANPTIGTLKKIAGVIGCDWREFFDDEFADKPVNPVKTDGVPCSSASIACPHCGSTLNIHID